MNQLVMRIPREDVQVIVAGLRKLPIKQVLNLLQAVKEQLDPQLQQVPRLDEVVLSITPEAAQVVASGLAELPYETAIDTLSRWMTRANAILSAIPEPAEEAGLGDAPTDHEEEEAAAEEVKPYEDPAAPHGEPPADQPAVEPQVGERRKRFTRAAN